jgi:DNA-binding LytR/AlgR family response regulator
MTGAKIKCMIVDDEPVARDIILHYCSLLPELSVVAVCANALEAKNILQQQPVDILFLDINMPLLDGIAFVKTLVSKPQVIFTTAYKEFAVDAFELAAADYLLKPFSFERFIVAVDKTREKISNPLTLQQGEPYGTDHIFVRAEGKIIKVFFSELLVAEASGNYTRIITTGKTFLQNSTFTAFEALLPENIFLRVHRSFIINKKRITHIDGNTVYLDKVEVPVGSHYKERFLREIGLKE